MKFESLGLLEELVSAVREEGYLEPTPIQSAAIPVVLSGKDVLACAQTGTGKTAAFALPILNRLSAGKTELVQGRTTRDIRVLVLTPTRELATQIGDSFRRYGRELPIRGAVIFGGVSQQSQVKALREGLDILVATPGRLMDLMNQKHVQLRGIEIFVLDEADRMLDMGFIRDVKKIIAVLPKKRQTLFFSATMPTEIAKLSQQILSQPAKIEVTPVASTVSKIEQGVYFVGKKQKMPLLSHLMKSLNVQRALVFTRTKRDANKVSDFLNGAGIKSAAIHGNKSQSAREAALDSLKQGKSRVLVATDIAARGIDIDLVTHVFNFNIPNDSECYVHRIGRTARAGASGTALSFCDPEEKGYLKDIEKLIKKQIVVMMPSAGMEKIAEPLRAPQSKQAPFKAVSAHPLMERNQARRPSRSRYRR